MVIFINIKFLFKWYLEKNAMWKIFIRMLFLDLKATHIKWAKQYLKKSPFRFPPYPLVQYNATIEPVVSCFWQILKINKSLMSTPIIIWGTKLPNKFFNFNQFRIDRRSNKKNFLMNQILCQVVHGIYLTSPENCVKNMVTLFFSSSANEKPRCD